MDRRRLKKYLGQEKRYAGKVVAITKDLKVVLKDITMGNKKITDHVIVGMGNEFLYEVGADVSFLATAYSYKRKDGSRTYGLRSAHNYMTIERLKLHEEMIAVNQQIQKRSRK